MTTIGLNAFTAALAASNVTIPPTVSAAMSRARPAGGHDPRNDQATSRAATTSTSTAPVPLPAEWGTRSGWLVAAPGDRLLEKAIAAPRRVRDDNDWGRRQGEHGDRGPAEGNLLGLAADATGVPSHQQRLNGTRFTYDLALIATEQATGAPLPSGLGPRSRRVADADGAR